MKVKKLAAAFDMSVSELAKLTEYARPSLYRVIEGSDPVDKKRYTEMYKKLRKKAADDCKDELDKAKKRYEMRLATLDYMVRERFY